MLSGLVSVTAGVLGFLFYWSCDLDFVTLGCTILAIGLGIDFTAHICHAYHRDWSLNIATAAEGEPAPLVKLRCALAAVGWPTLQAGLATWIGVLPLVLVPSYVVRTFFKTASLVVLFGLAHGLVWLPQMMYSLDNGHKDVFRIRKKK